MQNNHVGIRLYTIRDKKGETLEKVAEAVGISHVALSRYENGQRMPKMDILARLAEYYGVTVDSLIGREKEPEQEDDAWSIRERLRRDPNYRLLFDAADRASPEHLRAAAAMLKALEGNEND